MKRYDLAIIGSGPGGYVAALYASRRKLNVCVIEKDLLGGTCLNRGCIPTKAMLNSASFLSKIKDASIHGIEAENVRIDFQRIAKRRDDVISKLRAGIETLFRANKVDLLNGSAVFKTKGAIDLNGETIEAGHIIIATGSRPSGLPGIKFDESRVFSSDGIVNITEIPKSILIIGGGVIGCEFATLFNALGAKVTLVELLDRILITQSREASKKLESIFRKRGIDVLTSTNAEEVMKRGAEKILVAVGRVPNTTDMGLEGLGIRQEKGKICVNEFLRTSVDNIYAVGDCINGPLLAHKASYDGILACDNILGEKRIADYSNIPSCIYTDPEIASVGLTEEDAKTRYQDAKVAKFPYMASGKALISGKTEGFIKMVGDSNGKILGIEIMGEEACDLIGEATLAKTVGMKIKDLCRVVHGHPTLSEIFQEAAHIFDGTGIHSI